uniref:Coiled-coil-helix-coiled-coil-helix domain containing 2 n=1 Tax=Eptatretus burgeri TaxID=7764 RepID=A0A8C4N318_EPTBU
MLMELYCCFLNSRAPPRPAPAAHPPARVPPQPTAVAPTTASRPPGLMAQMASTAAGVAVGSTVGHVVGHALTGGLEGSEKQPDVTYQETPSEMATNPSTMPCQLEVRQFLECAQQQHDLGLCEGFNEALRQCKQAWLSSREGSSK